MLGLGQNLTYNASNSLILSSEFSGVNDGLIHYFATENLPNTASGLTDEYSGTALTTYAKTKDFDLCKIPGAFAMDGADACQSINLASNSLFPVGDFTFQFWFYCDASASQTGYILRNYYGANGNPPAAGVSGGIVLTNPTTTTIRCIAFSQGNAAPDAIFVSSGALAADTWHYLALINDTTASTLSLWTVNESTLTQIGIDAAPTYGNYNTPYDHLVEVGLSTSTPNMAAGDYRIYNRVLSNQELTENYNATSSRYVANPFINK
jgi:hypothetical protein